MMNNGFTTGFAFPWNNGFSGGFGGHFGGHANPFSGGHTDTFNPAMHAMWSWYQNNYCANPGDCTCTPGNTSCFSMPGAWSPPSFFGGSTTPWNGYSNFNSPTAWNFATPFNQFGACSPNNFYAGRATPSFYNQNSNPFWTPGANWGTYSNTPANGYPYWNSYGAPAFTPAFNSGFTPWWNSFGACTPNFSYAPNFHPFNAAPSYPWNTAYAKDNGCCQNNGTNGAMNFKRDAA